MALFLRCWTATRARAAAAAVAAESVHSRTAQNEIRMVLEAVIVFFLGVLDSRVWSYFCARQRRKDSRRLGRGFVGPPFGAQMAALAAQGLQAQSGTFSRSITQASVVFY